MRSDIYNRFYRELVRPNGIGEISLLIVEVPKLVFTWIGIQNQTFFIKKLKIQPSKKKNLAVVPRIDFKNIKDRQLPSISGEASERDVQKILTGGLFSCNFELGAIREIELLNQVGSNGKKFYLHLLLQFWSLNSNSS